MQIGLTFLLPQGVLYNSGSASKGKWKFIPTDMGRVEFRESFQR